MYREFSRKQLAAITWWWPSGKFAKYDAIICDGAARSGKSFCLSISFVLWSLYRFERQCFALCGKTVTSLRRNVIVPLKEALLEMGCGVEEIVSQSLLIVTYKGNSGRYYLFGGNNKSSADLIQGVTLAGVLLDEVALMPRSFVEQAMARCSVEGSKFFFCCNPEHPGHWFYTEWIVKKTLRKAFYLHFTMADNPALSPEIIARYKRIHSGAFYDRYVLGKWSAVHGVVYPMFDSSSHVVENVPICCRYLVSCDYGTVNPASFGLWGFCEEDDVWYRVREYYHDSRKVGRQLTDEEYCDALIRLAAGLSVEAVYVDPSAASFIQSLRNRALFPVIAAQNDVATGINRVAVALSERKIRIHHSCRDCIREFGLYCWNLDAAQDVPIKEHDHAMDDVRYFVAAAFAQKEIGGFAVASVSRS